MDPKYPMDRQRSNRFDPQVKAILKKGTTIRAMIAALERKSPWRFDWQAKRFLRVTTAHEHADSQENTDFFVEIPGKKIRVSSRVRRHASIQYLDEFTIRSDRKTGMQTELDKLFAGYGDFQFYSFADEEDQAILYWVLIDLSLVKASWNSLTRKEGQAKSSGHSFVAIKINSLPEQAVVQCSFNMPLPIIC